MKFYADLHVHSKYSRATSRDAGLEEFSAWAARKGLAVLGTGDFTHPAWRAEIRDKLVPAEPGLFRLRDDLARAAAERVPPACRADTRFLLQVEISTIYKKDGATRKVHHLVFASGFDEAERLSAALARVGNLASDGRPILGLDSRHLLEITLEAGAGCFLIPAHIWTPWFSALGSKSGFDRIDDCYGDLAPHVFAVETGLSSDPPMNWRVSSLDRFRLVSNSDAHSPAKLGREACVFDTDRDYFAMRRALETGAGYAGTVEFFPEEGKYHLDGHRACNVRLEPAETRKLAGRCPTCGKPLTVGVMNRVEELADRPDGARPPGAADYRCRVPLPEALSEIVGAGPDSRKVQSAWDHLVARLGPELFILNEAPIEAIARAGSALLADGIGRMRRAEVIRDAGYDGEYGVIRLFRPDELTPGAGVSALFDVPPDPPAPKPTRTRAEPGGGARPDIPEAASAAREPEAPGTEAAAAAILDALDPEQRAAAEIVRGPLLIVAGPGTGKTRTLTRRIARLVADEGVPPESCLAITFTNRAANEMAVRLAALLPGAAARIRVTTFHALGWLIVRENARRLGYDSEPRVIDEPEAIAILREVLDVTERQAARLRRQVSAWKREAAAEARPAGTAETEWACTRYAAVLRERALVDFDDLVRLPVDLLAEREDVRAAYQSRFPWVSIDEYQDIDPLQYRLVRLLVPPDGNICAIGDPDQSIYGFRGSDVGIFGAFAVDFPGARVARLTRNYRSGRCIVAAAVQAIAPSTLVESRTLEAQSADATRVAVRPCASEAAEAEFITHTIERLVGGSGFFSMDSGRVGAGEGEALSFSDFAVLYRTEAQAEALIEALARSGMPFQSRTHGRLSQSPAVARLIAAMEASPGADRAPRLALARAVEVLADDPAQAEIERAAQMLHPVAARSQNLAAFRSEIAMASDADLWDPRADRVSLLTLHAAKGLEFDVVFLAGCEDGILPLRWGGDESEANLAEERRLFFVGLTRARRRLYLSHARRRRWMGTTRDMEPSPFLSPIAEELLERSRGEPGARSRPTHEQLDLL